MNDQFTFPGKPEVIEEIVKTLKLLRGEDYFCSDGNDGDIILAALLQYHDGMQCISEVKEDKSLLPDSMVRLGVFSDGHSENSGVRLEGNSEDVLFLQKFELIIDSEGRDMARLSVISYVKDEDGKSIKKYHDDGTVEILFEEIVKEGIIDGLNGAILLNREDYDALIENEKDFALG